MGPINTYIICAIFVILFTFGKTEHQSDLTNYSSSTDINSVEASTEIHCNTDVRLHKIKYTWNINNFNLHRPEGGEKNSIISPTFSSATNNRIKWYLEIQPGNETSEEISFYVRFSSESKEPKARAKFLVDFLDDEGNLIIRFGDESFYAFDNQGDLWGWDNIQIDEVLLPDNKLKMVCNITFCENTNKISHINRTNATLNSECDLCQNFDSLFNNSQNSDLILKLVKNGNEYPAHKIVLAARSPVFAGIFKRYKKVQQINITELDEHVFEQTLKYIYTTKCENIEKSARGLLQAARKFGLDRLEAICVDEISKKLTAENATDTLILADKHGIDRLKSKTIRFIAANYANVSNTTDWKRMVETNSKFVHEVCQYVIKLHEK